MYINGMSTYQISDILNEEKIEPPAVYLKMNLVHRFQKITINGDQHQYKNIKNEVYLGKLLQGKTKS